MTHQDDQSFLSLSFVSSTLSFIHSLYFSFSHVAVKGGAISDYRDCFVFVICRYM